MRDLVFYSLEPWDEIWRRNQFVVDLLVRRNPALRVLFVAPAANLAKRHTWLNGVAGPREMPRPLATHDRVFLAQPVRLPFESISALRKLNERLHAWALRRWTRCLGMKRPVLWINDHHRAHLARRAGGPVLYDITDDWIEAAPPSPERDAIARHDAELCRRADATIVCSTRLAELKRDIVPSRGHLHVVANGVHVDHYSAVRDRSGPMPDITRDWERPVYGYTGTFHPERVDVVLVEAVARRLLRGTMVFIGPNMLDEAGRQRLTATGRVRFVPAVPYAQIPDYMRAMDVMMVPHRVSAFVESLNPIKLWEYLAAGLPIVTTPVAGFREFPHLVTLADGADAFVTGLEAATSEPGDRAANRVREATAHSWESRVEQIEKIISGCEAAVQARRASPVEAVRA